MRRSVRHRRGNVAIEEIMALAVLLPVAFGAFWFCWSMSGRVYEIIRVVLATPLL